MMNDNWTETILSWRFLNPRVFGCLLVFLTLSSCANNDDLNSANLAVILASYDESQLDEVIACAASDRDHTGSDIYYYPIPGAFNIQYFETTSTNVDPNDFSNYTRRTLMSQDVFGGYLERFIRSGNDEVFSIVTFETPGKFHRSNPIRLKQNSKPTEYHQDVMIDNSEMLMPRFSWNDGAVAENAIYFQVISDENDGFISGTYTFERWFQYYNLSNVVLNINREVPEDLILQEAYNSSMLAVSIDNWVNLINENFPIAGVDHPVNKRQ